MTPRNKLRPLGNMLALRPLLAPVVLLAHELLFLGRKVVLDVKNAANLFRCLAYAHHKSEKNPQDKCPLYP